jgi:hypothetical protein
MSDDILSRVREIAKRHLTDEQFDALFEVQEFADLDDWLHPPERFGAYWFMPVRFLAYIDHFKIVGEPPAECLGLSAPMHGDWTYFALGKLNGLIKIGRSRSPKYRVWQLKSDPRHGQPAEFLATIPGDLEVEYHRIFARWRVEGEWFAPHPDLLAEIERLRA